MNREPISKLPSWAAEMKAAQESGMPTPLRTREGAGVVLMEGTPGELLDADPPPGLAAKWRAGMRSNAGDVGKLIDRQQANPQITAALTGSDCTGPGTFAGVARSPITLTHTTGGQWRLQGAVIDWTNLVEGEFRLESVFVPDITLQALRNLSTIAGFRLTWGRPRDGDSIVRLAFEVRERIRPQSQVEAVSLAGMTATDIDTGVPSAVPGVNVTERIYANVGTDFLPWFALVPTADGDFWHVHKCLDPNNLITLGRFPWWP